ncbi:hypothetical protein COEREDRAFT_86641 [Coemansia reversa NRRL 1564]|uniref:Uncharacterized protein n=1 Tax=Coemansia reversa (strain ATCC 12441 / NRRL 1564) TaxID=763665 RepID=A0A2G5BCZ2_COERN|nr:hypothetical protein COEREDRAFT_86641 [Coemansia reversa NRRL 1564]|eukprot:PIA16879.1 hypothetical protein COEREDRAFT_86641 [Coemansia reversa NRRL 1564]
MEQTISKSELAQNIADWATNELGFRKSTTLVTAKGEEKITGTEVEPLLQGELADILEKALTHLVSSQSAERSRRRISAFCSQSLRDKDIQSLEHVALTRNLAALCEKKQAISTDIKGIELENHSTIRSINEIEAKRRAAEGRIREYRLQILKKQLMAERLRRMTSRMKILTQEMRTGADTMKIPSISAEAIVSVHGASSSDEHESDSPYTLLSGLISKLKATPAESQHAINSTQALDGTDVVEKSQLTIANIVYLLKSLEDQHLEMWSSTRAKRAQLDIDRSNLFGNFEEVAGQMRVNAPADNNGDYDYKVSIFKVVLRDAVAQVDKSVKALLPALKIAEKSTWSSNEHNNKAAEVAKSIKTIQKLIATSQYEASEIKTYAGVDVVDAHQNLVQALRYIDLRGAWDSICMSNLQRIYLESSDGEKENKAASGKLVARSCFSGVERDRRLCDIAHETTSISNQAHETTVERLGHQTVQVLRIAHMINAMEEKLAESIGRTRQLGRSLKNTPRALYDPLISACLCVTESQEADIADKPLVMVDALRAYSQEQRASASAAMAEWAATSKVMQYLQTAKNSAETEDEIAELSDTSGRLFTETFAPWYRRDGISYAEYLKRLKIARASEKQNIDDQGQSL